MPGNWLKRGVRERAESSIESISGEERRGVVGEREDEEEDDEDDGLYERDDVEVFLFAC